MSGLYPIVRRARKSTALERELAEAKAEIARLTAEKDRLASELARKGTRVKAQKETQGLPGTVTQASSAGAESAGSPPGQ